MKGSPAPKDAVCHVKQIYRGHQFVNGLLPDCNHVFRLLFREAHSFKSSLTLHAE
ncbi:MAG: hypothetical protein QOI58_2996 [Thermoanaerobaculia bacterium]|nr:hypothetical protein [Thermoanaerobaculia bacterium]